MESRILFFLITMVFATFFGCQKSYAPIEYKTWIESEESGLFKKKSIGSLTYSVQYQTPEYLVLLGQGPDRIKQCNLQEETAKYSGDLHFMFTISTQTGEYPLKFQLNSTEQFYARQEYLNSEVTKDFYLINSSDDTLNCLFAHAERDFGISPDLNINLAFTKTGDEESYKFCYNDRLFNNGMIKFSFSSDEIKDLPELRQE